MSILAQHSYTGNVTEKQPYEVVKKFAEFELRRYPESQLATVTVTGDLPSAGNRAFSPLVTYISGGNQSSQKIAMTAPVIQAPAGGDVHQVSFVMPADMSADDLPVPRDARVTVHTEPEHYAVAHRFSGTCTEKRFYEKGEQLKKAVSQSVASGELSANFLGEVFFARYDPPWMPGLARRNEALIKVSLGKQNS